MTVMNHIHPMDCTMVKLAAFPRMIHYMSMPGNLTLPFVGWLVCGLGAVPLPESTHDLLALEHRLEAHLRRGGWIHYYAEGLLVRYHREVRPFHKGAFLTAVRADCPVIPMRVVCEAPHGIRRLWRHKPFLHVVIGAPLYRDPNLPTAKAVEDLMERTHRAVEDLGTEGPDSQPCTAQ